MAGCENATRTTGNTTSSRGLFCAQGTKGSDVHLLRCCANFYRVRVPVSSCVCGVRYHGPSCQLEELSQALPRDLSAGAVSGHVRHREDQLQPDQSQHRSSDQIPQGLIERSYRLSDLQPPIGWKFIEM